MNQYIFFNKNADLRHIQTQPIGVIGYGNTAKAIALNLRDQGFEVIVVPVTEEYQQRARSDGFISWNLPDALAKVAYIFLLLSDELIPDFFNHHLQSHLKEHDTVIVASAYCLTFDQLAIPPHINVLVISPRAPGIAIREKFLTKEGIFSLIGIHQDHSKHAQTDLLALTKAIGVFNRPAVQITPRQQAVLALFTEQTFSYALSQVLMRAVDNLVDREYLPEAILVELLLSGEGSYTMDKAIEVGMIKQMNFHSQTSQYGQMSRATKFMKLGKEVEAIQREIYDEIDSGAFSKEWREEKTKLLLQIMQYCSHQTKYGQIERRVRTNLGFVSPKTFPTASFPSESEIQKYLGIEREIEKIKAFFGGI